MSERIGPTNRALVRSLGIPSSPPSAGRSNALGVTSTSSIPNALRPREGVQHQDDTCGTLLDPAI